MADARGVETIPHRGAEGAAGSTIASPGGRPEWSRSTGMASASRETFTWRWASVPPVIREPTSTAVRDPAIQSFDRHSCPTR